GGERGRRRRGEGPRAAAGACGQGDRPDREAEAGAGGHRAAQDPLGQDHAPPAARRRREPPGGGHPDPRRRLGDGPDPAGDVREALRDAGPGDGQRVSVTSPVSVTAVSVPADSASEPRSAGSTVTSPSELRVSTCHVEVPPTAIRTSPSSVTAPTAPLAS